MTKRIVVVVAAIALVLGSLLGCGRRGVANSADATPQDPLVLTMAHSLAEDHPTGEALENFAAKVAEASGGRITVQICPNGQLGSETEVIEQLMAGVVDVTRVASPGLSSFDEGYHAFGLPYIFESEDEYYRVMESEGMRQFFEATRERGLIGLTYYTSGERSFYTVNRPIRRPQDLRGLRIRVQDMRSQTDLVNTLGGTPIVMPFGEQYTALQTGILDGAESNETVLTQSRHGEVTKEFSLTRHTRIPDIMIIGTNAWDRLTPQDQELVRAAARGSTQDHKVAWAKAIEEAVQEARGMGVTFTQDVDIDAFRELTDPMVQRYAQEYPRVAHVLAIIDGERAK